MKIEFGKKNPAKKTAKKPRDPKASRRASLVILAVIIVLAVFLLLVGFLTDWLWFKEVGYVSVFFKKLFTQLKFGVPAFVVLAALMQLYLTRLKKGYFSKINSHEVTDHKKLNRFTVVISVLFGLVASVYFVSNLWFQLLQFVNATDFGISDPLYDLDISFYIFRLDFLSRLNEMIIGLVLLIVIATVIYYLILLVMHSPDLYEEEEAIPVDDGSEDDPLRRIFNRSTERRQLSKSNFEQLMKIASAQLTFLGVVFFLMLGAHAFLDQFDLLHTHTGVVYGAGYTDIHVTLWMYRIEMVLAVAGAVITAVSVRKKNFKRLLIVPALMIFTGAAGMGIGALVQSMIVAPDEIHKEQEYLANNIEYTNYAYDIDDVESRTFAASNSLTAEDIANNPETVSNIRINDYEPVKTFYNQTQSIRQYYTFNDTDVDRYMVNGEYTQTYLAVRELDEKKVNDTWLNRHLMYTHGYGAAVSRVDTLTSSGQPDVIVKDIPPATNAEALTITRPEIYFGELSGDYIIVNTNEDEFDYPDGESNHYTRYEGTAGIRLGFLNRVLFSIREQSMKLLVSSNVKSDSRIIIHRNVLERVRKIMPYISYEDDPYCVVADGRLYWMLDAYTTSSYYPYSEPYSAEIGSTNYIRNSIKVVVDAYNGDVSYYVVDAEDPIAVTLQKIFPTLLKDYSEMPEALQAHLRYPNTLFRIQADVYARYHMHNVQNFYQNEDIWEVSHEIYGTEEKKITPNYFVVDLPDTEGPEFVSMLPYSPKSKQNMTAILLTRNDGAHYGELVLYVLPKNRTIYGPMQVEAQISQNTKISQDFSLWNQEGSTYRRGNLFVVPIEDSLLYVEPIYLEASNSAIPEVKRVIVAYGDKIAYESNLNDALISLFGEGTGLDGNAGGDPDAVIDGGTGTIADYIAKASAAYDSAQAALKDGDWAAYGRYMDELEDALKKLEAAQGGTDTTEPDAAQPDSGADTQTDTDTADQGDEE